MSAGTGSVGGAVLAVDEAPNPWIDPSYVAENWDTILRYLGEHVRLTVGAVVLGALIALPLALLARRSRYLAGPVLAVSTIVYTIPSLAMFAFIFPFTGLSATTVLIGLVAYSLVILVRNFLTGLRGVPDRRPGGRPRHGLRQGAAVLADRPAAGPARVHDRPADRHGLDRGPGHRRCAGRARRAGPADPSAGSTPTSTGPRSSPARCCCVLLALLADVLLAGAERLVTPWARAVTDVNAFERGDRSTSTTRTTGPARTGSSNCSASTSRSRPSPSWPRS